MFEIFCKNYDRYSIAVSPIPYINYSSYEYSILTGPAFTIVYTLSGLIIAIECSDSFLSISKYLVLSIGTFIFSVAFLTTAIATTFWQQIIIRVVIGISQSIVTPFSTSIISEIFPTELLGSAFGIYNSGTYFAFALSLSLGTYIYQNFGWQAGYILFGLIGIGVAVVIPCFRRYLNGNYSQNYSRLSTDSSHNGSNPSVIHCETITPFSSISIYSVNSVESSSATSGTIEQELKRVSKSSFHRFFMVVHEIFWINWGKHSYIYLLCLATGLRLGGGYIWAAYTSVFFSELFVDEENGSKCYYSHNSDYTDSYTGVCGKSYPYCVDSSCVKLSESPWHNQGIDSELVETYFAWIPLLGSATGNILGGLLSDRFVAAKTIDKDEKLVAKSELESPINGSSELSPTDEATLTPTQSPEFPAYSDNNSPMTKQDDSVRMLLSGIGGFLALPLVISALLLDKPWCFIIMIGSGLVGELYLGQSLAIIAGPTAVPATLVTQSVALFMFIVTIIGGNMPLLIPSVASVLQFSDATITFTASVAYSPDAVANEPEAYSISNTNAKNLQYSIIFSFILSYGISSVLYLFCWKLMKKSL